MPLVKPFAGLRPVSGQAGEIAAPPYDVISEDEARRMVEGRPWSFLHISRPEVDLPVGTDPHAPEVYAKAAENLAKMEHEGLLLRDDKANYYVYRLTMGQYSQTGLVAVASVAAYEAGRIRRHEFTRPAKEEDRVNQIMAVNAQTGPVLLAYPDCPPVDDVLMLIAAAEPELDITARDGVRHQLWLVSDPALITELTRGFDSMPALYVADGHHRTAAACRVAAMRRAENPAHMGEEPYNYFLCVIFPHHQMQILEYNRVIRDLNGLSAEAFLEKVAESFDISLASGPVKPERAAEFGMYLEGDWYLLRLHRALMAAEDPVARLGVSHLADNLIEPVLGITDPRRDGRIDFVGGIRGLEELERRVDSGEMAVAFSLFPTRMEELMAVADAGEVMPPKSTWFEPKLADGLVSHCLD